MTQTSNKGIRVQLEDFQSWETADMTIKNLTVVVGSSDLGKSAVFRAVRGALRNSIPQGAVRKGTKRTRVSLDIGGIEVEAIRPLSGSVEYKVDGVPYSKLAGDVPEAVIKLGFEPIQAGNYTFDPIFARQFDQPFLLSSSPAEVTALLGAFSSTEKLDNGKRELAKRGNTLDAQASVLAESVRQLNHSVQTMGSVRDFLFDTRDDLVIRVKDIKTTTLIHNGIKSLIETTRRRDVGRETLVVTHIDDTTPLINTTAAVVSGIHTLIDNRDTVLRSTICRDAISYDFQSAYEQLKQATNELIYIRRAVNNTTTLNKLHNERDRYPDTVVITTEDVTKQRVVSESLERLVEQRRLVDSRRATLANVHGGLSKTLSEINATVAVITTLTNLITSRRSVLESKQSTDAIEIELSTLHSDLARMKGEMDVVVCPKCNHEFPAEEGRTHDRCD